MLQIALLLAVLANTQDALAKNTRPSSGRPLEYGHWLTCWGGTDRAHRRDQMIKSNWTEADVQARPVPALAGRYQFEVKDTWEELVTKSGSDCFHCGETCTKDKDGNQSCSCNYCSWQELETFYRPWSTQTATWRADWSPREDYAQRRRAWLKQGKPEIARDKSEIAKLQKFDPDRPTEYYLFPGEVETLRVDNGSGSSIEPELDFTDARHEYEIQTVTNGRAGARECDDVDLRIQSTIVTGDRKVTKTPNSLEFRADWMVGGKPDPSGKVTDEPAAFRVADLGAQLYENQNVMDHYKDTQLQIRMLEINRAWAWDRFISQSLTAQDLQGDLVKTPVGDGDVRIATFEFDTMELLEYPKLHPGRKYELCGRVFRDNNVYYKKKTWWFGGKAWSEYACQQFEYEGPDRRSGGRKTRDFIAKYFLFLW